MNHDEIFTPEGVDEQIDQLTYSQHQESLSPNIQLIQGLQAHYVEDQGSQARMWNRLAEYAAEHQLSLQPSAIQSEPLNEVLEERYQPMQIENKPVKRHYVSRFALIAAVLVTFLLVGSLLAIFQAARSHQAGTGPNSSQTGSGPTTDRTCTQYASSQTQRTASSQGLYLGTVQNIEKLDPQTCKTSWRTAFPAAPLSYAPTPEVLGNTVYLILPDQFYALDSHTGHIRWSRSNLNVGQIFLSDGLLYAASSPLATKAQTLIALDPANGALKATYPAPASGWNSPQVVHGVLYYASGSSLYAVRLADQHKLWQQDFTGQFSLDSLQVANGIVYLQVMVMHPPTGTDGRVEAFDASKGTKLWESPALHTGVRMITVTATTVYAASIGTLDAFNAQNGRQLWHQNLDTFNLLVDSGKLYIGYGPVAKEGVTALAALQATDGTLLWTINVPWLEADSPLGLANGILYTEINDGKNGAIDAFKVNDGSPLWHMPLKGDATKWQATLA